MALADHIRYLERRLAGFVPEAIHRAQIAAYRAALDAARAADSDQAYLAATGDLLELTRAEWLDRYETAARFYDGIGDGVRAEIARDSAEVAREAGDHTALIRAVVGAKLASAARRQGAESAASLVPVLVQSLIGLRLETDPMAARERRDELAAMWREMADGDPLLSPRRLLEHAPYRARLPFDDAGVEALIAWLEALDLEPPPAPEPAAPAEPPALQIPPPAAIPTAEAIAAPYRAAAAALDPDNPALEPLRSLYAQIDELAASADDGNALIAAMAEADVFAALARAPLVAEARRTRAAIAADQPMALAHLDRLIAALESARSVAEIELCALAAEEHQAAESAWAHLLFFVALLPIGAAIAYDVDRSEWRLDHLRRCEATVRELFGGGTAALLSTEAVWSVFVTEIFERGQAVDLEGGGDRPVHRGETAMSIGGAVQAAMIQWALAESAGADDVEAALHARLEAGRFATPEAMRDHVLAVLDGAGVTPAAEPRNLVMWRSPIEWGDLAAALRTPPRPALPL